MGMLVLAPFVQTARAAAPSGPHPRIWLDAATQQQLQAHVSLPDSATARAVAKCQDAYARPDRYTNGGWQGFNFVEVLSSCLIAYAAGSDSNHRDTALKYFRVLLDDYQTVGDGAGGDEVVRHDSGYAMRTFAPYAALAYDWLYDAPGMTAPLREHARARFAAWTDWYFSSGYLRDVPGANYHAGFVYAATLIAIAHGADAGAAGDALYQKVLDDLWVPLNQSMQQGVLAGGDWPEGWQYGPLSVFEYALAGRALADAGVSLPGLAAWTDSLVERYEHGLAPGRRGSFVGGDTENDSPWLSPSGMPLFAVLAGKSSEAARSWARALVAELGIIERGQPFYQALAEARPGPAGRPSNVPLSYQARGNGTLYLRGGWQDSAPYAVLQCARQLVPDHRQPAAGNFVFSRGPDDLVVDPSPYGSLSTLTTNAPAVSSNNLPNHYRPSQAVWGLSTGFAWAGAWSHGVYAARCDYSDQFRFREVPSDVLVATRDFVFWTTETDAVVAVLDRVQTGDASRGPLLRFRSPVVPSLSGALASAQVGTSALAITRAFPSVAASSDVRPFPAADDCFSSPRGGCDAARFSGGEYRVGFAGPGALALHLVSGRDPSAAPLDVTGFSTDVLQGASVSGVGGTTVVVAPWNPKGVAPLVYQVAKGRVRHVVLDAPRNASEEAAVEANESAGACEIHVSAHPGTGARKWGVKPLTFEMSESCEVMAATQIASVSPLSNAPPETAPGTSPIEPLPPAPQTEGEAPTEPFNSDNGCGCRGGSAGAFSLWLCALVVWAAMKRGLRR